MKSYPLWLALSLVVAINVFVLTGVARNRAGAPEASLVLTEREMPLNIDAFHDENSDVSLPLTWNQSYGIDEWFNAAKLTELGIDVRPVSEKRENFRRLLPKKAFLVLEYEGDVWRRFKAEKERELADLEGKLAEGKIDEQTAKNQRYWINRTLRFDSRLFAVDVGIDPRQLRQHYPDNHRYLIVAASVRATSRYRDQQEIPHGMIDSLLITHLHIPVELHAPLLGLRSSESFIGYQIDEPKKIPRPRYEVRVEWGQRYEPWVTEVKLIEEEVTD